MAEQNTDTLIQILKGRVRPEVLPFIDFCASKVYPEAYRAAVKIGLTPMEANIAAGEIASLAVKTMAKHVQRVENRAWGRRVEKGGPLTKG